MFDITPEENNRIIGLAKRKYNRIDAIAKTLKEIRYQIIWYTT